MQITTEMLSLGSVHHEPVGKQISDQLRRMIVRREILPGTRLREDDYVKKFEVSKTTVREAFTILAQEGMLDKLDNRFTRVVSFSKADVVDLFEMRIAVEQLAVERCIRNGTIPNERLNSLNAFLISFQRRAAREEKDEDTIYHMTERGEINSVPFEKDEGGYEEFIDEDMRFHQAIVEGCGNKRAIAVWLSIKGPLKMLFYSQVARFPISIYNPNSRAHASIIEVMNQGNISGAREMIRDHINGSLWLRLQDPMLTDNR